MAGCGYDGLSQKIDLKGKTFKVYSEKNDVLNNDAQVEYGSPKSYFIDFIPFTRKSMFFHIRTGNFIVRRRLGLDSFAAVSNASNRRWLQ